MEKAFDISMIASFVPTLLGYLPVTLYILAVSLLFGFLLGLLLALPASIAFRLESVCEAVYLFFRGTPIMVQLFIVFYGIPALTALAGIDTSKMDSLYAYRHVCAEQRGKSGGNHQGRCEQRRPRAGGGGVQHRAERGQTFRRIILPQALVHFPNIGNMVIGFLKDTSLAFSIGVMDMSGRGQTLITSSNHSLEVYISLSVLYYACPFI